MPDAPLPPLPPVGQPRWRTAIDDIGRRLRARPVAPLPLAIAGALAIGVVVGLVLLRPRTSAPAAPLPLATPAPAEPGEPADQGPQALRRGPEELVVDVAGAVTRPGLVRLPAGSRVADAVAAAGGPAADAALTALNQARVLADGEQVRVPRVGEPAPSAPSPGPGRSSGSTNGAPAAPVDLNLATVAELDTLPGVGPATASAIIAWREENGGFRRVDDLLEVPGIGPARLERLRPLVRV